jgi:hypothetical protein
LEVAPHVVVGDGVAAAAAVRSWLGLDLLAFLFRCPEVVPSALSGFLNESDKLIGSQYVLPGYIFHPSFRQHRGTQNGRKNVFLTIIRY